MSGGSDRNDREIDFLWFQPGETKMSNEVDGDFFYFEESPEESSNQEFRSSIFCGGIKIL